MDVVTRNLGTICTMFSPKKLSSCWPMRTRTLAYILRMLLCVLVGHATVISLPPAFGVVDWRVAGSSVGVVSLIGFAWCFFLGSE